MKVFVLALCVFGFVAVHHCQKMGAKGEGWRKMIEDCKTETKATDDEVHNMRSHVVETRNEQCMLACINKKTGTMGEDNKINSTQVEQMYARMKEYNPERWAKMKIVLDTCKAAETPEKDQCVAAKKYADCIKTKSDEAGIRTHH